MIALRKEKECVEFQRLTMKPVLCSLVGLQYFHRGSDDFPQPAGDNREGAVFGRE